MQSCKQFDSKASSINIFVHLLALYHSIQNLQSSIQLSDSKDFYYFDFMTNCYDSFRVTLAVAAINFIQKKEKKKREDDQEDSKDQNGG